MLVLKRKVLKACGRRDVHPIPTPLNADRLADAIREDVSKAESYAALWRFGVDLGP